MRGTHLLIVAGLLGCAAQPPSPAPAPGRAVAANAAAAAAADSGCVPHSRVVARTGGPLYFEYQVEQPARPEPALPRPAAPAGLEGRSGGANLMFVVDTAGRVEMSTVTVKSASDHRYGEAACATLREARFAPARLGGHPVRMWYQTDFRF